MVLNNHSLLRHIWHFHIMTVMPIKLPVYSRFNEFVPQHISRNRVKSFTHVYKRNERWLSCNLPIVNSLFRTSGYLGQRIISLVAEVKHSPFWLGENNIEYPLNFKLRWIKITYSIPKTYCAVGCSYHNMMLEKLSFHKFQKGENRCAFWITALYLI